MSFCEACGVLIPPNAATEQCKNCDPANGVEILSKHSHGREGSLETLRSTKNGAIRKRDSMTWLKGLNRPSPTELRSAVLPKPAGFTGKTFETDISNIRVTGDAAFVEAVAGLLQPLAELENDETRLEISLKRTKVRDTSQYTGNYALYLSVAERSGK